MQLNKQIDEINDNIDKINKTTNINSIISTYLKNKQLIDDTKNNLDKIKTNFEDIKNDEIEITDKNYEEMLIKVNSFCDIFNENDDIEIIINEYKNISNIINSLKIYLDSKKLKIIEKIET